MTRPFTLYWMTQTAADVPKHNGWLSRAERRVLAGKRFLKRRADWRLGRWTAKNALRALFFHSPHGGDLAAIEIAAGDDGAPSASINGEPTAVAISLSHGGGVGLCVIGSGPFSVGCDVETIEPRSREFVADYFTDAERAYIRRAPSSDRARMTTLLWSAKESVLKVLREGLRRDTRSVAVQIGGGRGPDPWDWRPFSAACREAGHVFHGWWKAAGGQVLCLAAPLETQPPIGLTDSRAIKFDNDQGNLRHHFPFPFVY